MNITVATLIYKSPQYLDFVMGSLLSHSSKNHNMEYLIVCNDATKEVIEHANDKWSEYARVVNHINDPKDPWWIQNVYAAWNRCVKECRTPFLSTVNSDMAFTDGWLDALAKYNTSRYIPTSRLVESERMPSLRGLISKNFGQTLATFDKDKFEKFAEEVKEDRFITGVGAYGPNLFDVNKLRSIGGFSKNRGNIPGDKITFWTLKQKYNLSHVMVCDSIVYHMQRGESFECGDEL